MSIKTPEHDVLKHSIVSHEAWLEARKTHLAKEKAFTRMRDELSKERRNLPWERVDKEYVFEGPEGSRSLRQLFGDNSQLVVYHFMFAPEWDAGCRACSFWADNFSRITPHLRACDISFMAISRAPIAKLEAYSKRLGWSFPWFSSGDNGFNQDYHVSFTPDEIAHHRGTYNYRPIEIDDETDYPGVSVFVKAEDGAIYHTYSAYSRGIDMLNGAYNYMDLTPKGRGEEGEHIMAWLRRNDEYDN